MTEENAVPAGPNSEVATIGQADQRQRVQADDLPPEALKQRIDRAAEKGRHEGRQAWLAENGFADEAAAKQALADYKAKLEAQKSAEEKLAELNQMLESTRNRSSLYEAVIAERCEIELAKLSDSQKSAVLKLAGDDKAATLRAIDTLSPTWAQPAVGTKQTTAQAAAATAPARNAAPPEATESKPDRRAEYDRLRAENPFKAEAYRSQYHNEIFPSQ